MNKRTKLVLSALACLAVCLMGLSGCPGGEGGAELVEALLPLGSPPEDGQYVEVNGNKIFYKKAGDADVKVVLIAGLDENVKIWNKVWDDFASFSSVVAYDRGGVGWSDPGEDPRTASVIAKELDAFLNAIDFEPPYVLCAHSMGGLFARYYAATYPEKVEGILLIDTTHEDQSARQALQLDPPDVAQAQTVMGLALTVQGRLQIGTQGEYFNMENTADEVRDNRSLPIVPLLLLSQDPDNIADINEDDEAPIASLLFHELYYEQSALTPLGEWRPVENTGHFIMLDQPQEVVDGLQEIIEEAKALR